MGAAPLLPWPWRAVSCHSPTRSPAAPRLPLQLPLIWERLLPGMSLTDHVALLPGHAVPIRRHSWSSWNSQYSKVTLFYLKHSCVEATAATQEGRSVLCCVLDPVCALPQPLESTSPAMCTHPSVSVLCSTCLVTCSLLQRAGCESALPHTGRARRDSVA